MKLNSNKDQADNNQQSTPISNSILIAFGFCLLLFIFSQFSLLKYWYAIWDGKDSYYSHGFLIPILVGIMVWLNLPRIALAKKQTSGLGIAVLIIGLIVYMFGRIASIQVIGIAAFFILLFGLVLAFFGKKVTGYLILPILFLVTMIPLPGWWLDGATAQLQLISTSIAAKALILFGAPITQQGNVINSMDLPEPLFIAAPCSGLKLLITLITSSLFIAYIVEGPRFKKAILIALAVPLSMFINAIRILMIAYVGIWTFSADAMHSFHDYSGYIGLVICSGLLIVFARIMGMRDWRVLMPKTKEFKLSKKPINIVVVTIICALILLSAGLTERFIAPMYEMPKGHLNRASIPMSFDGWIGTETPIDSNTIKVLEKGDLLSLNYNNNVTEQASVGVFVAAGYDTSAFHNPHSCLPSSGNRIFEDKEIKNETQWQTGKCNLFFCRK